MLASNVGNYVLLERVSDDEDLGVLYEKTDTEYRHLNADYFKTVAVRENGVIDLHQAHGTVNTGLWLKVS